MKIEITARKCQTLMCTHTQSECCKIYIEKICCYYFVNLVFKSNKTKKITFFKSIDL